MTEREKLIEELDNKFGIIVTRTSACDDIVRNIEIADFILARDKRIVEPLVICDKQWGSFKETPFSYMFEAIDQTLRNAGVGEK